jgi:hypothetical protein
MARPAPGSEIELAGPRTPGMLAAGTPASGGSSYRVPPAQEALPRAEGLLDKPLVP